jgi:hypothetical protein
MVADGQMVTPMPGAGHRRRDTHRQYRGGRSAGTRKAKAPLATTRTRPPLPASGCAHQRLLPAKVSLTGCVSVRPLRVSVRQGWVSRNPICDTYAR